MPPVWSQRTPSLPKILSQSKSPGLSWLAAVLPRSGIPTAPRTPKPRSVKLRPLRTTRPTPSNGTHLTNSVSTPPCRMKSSMSRPTSLSAKAVATAVLKPKQRRRPRATLYSPPPSQTLNSRAVRTRPSPGSRRSMTSPSAIRSYLQEAAGLSWSMDILEFPSPHDLPIVMISERINKITSVRLPDMQAELLEIREDEAALKLGLEGRRTEFFGY